MTLSRTVSLLSQQMEGALQEAVGLSVTDKGVLTRLAIAPSPLRMVDLAESLMVTKAGVTRMVDRLEDMGLVARRPSEEDRRVTHLTLTEAGRTRWEAARHVVHRCLHEGLFAHLSPEEVTQVRAVLERALDASDVIDIET